MQIDSFVSRTMARAATRMGLLRPAAALPAASEGDAVRGSGSWANEWSGARVAVDRARMLAARGRSRGGRGGGAEPIPEGSVRARPLMSGRAVKLHQWISDRLEAEAPTCTLHAGVALSAFLASDQAYPGYDPLAGLVADLVITDLQGQPVAALLREGTDAQRHLMTLDALLDADLPIVDLPARPTLSVLWSEIAAHLPEE